MRRVSVKKACCALVEMRPKKYRNVEYRVKHVFNGSVRRRLPRSLFVNLDLNCSGDERISKSGSTGKLGLNLVDDVLFQVRKLVQFLKRPVIYKKKQKEKKKKIQTVLFINANHISNANIHIYHNFQCNAQYLM